MSGFASNRWRPEVGRGGRERSRSELMLLPLGVLYLIGAAILVGSMLGPHEERANPDAILALAALAVPVGLALLLGARRLPGGVAPAAVLLGSALNGLAVHWGGEVSSFYAVMYVWVGAYSACFFGLRGTLLQLFGAGAAYGVVILTHPQPQPDGFSHWWILMVAVGVSTALVAWLVRNQREAQSAHRHLADLVAQSDEAIIGKSIDGTILSWNRGAEALYEYTAAEVVGREIAILIPPAYRDEYGQLLARLRADERIVNHESVRRRKDGTKIVVSLTISPIHDAAGHVTGASVVARDISRRKEEEQQREEQLALSRRQARTDALTGVANRRAWDAEVRKALARANREERPFCVALLDLDHFKRFNDRHGHVAGDQLLREAAATWETMLRETDVIARYGGEEFAILLPDSSPGDAQAIVERLRASTPMGESSSAGLAWWTPGESAESVTERADAALYEAKELGRDQLILAA